MKRTSGRPAADEIAEMADRGENISGFFTNAGRMKHPVKRVNVDFTLDMIHELDSVAGEMNISRQAAIKSFLRQSLDSHYVAVKGVTTPNRA